MARPRTKQGEHGTMYRYTIEYSDPDPGCPTFAWSCWAYNRDHALELFYADRDDWHVHGVTRQNER